MELLIVVCCYELQGLIWIEFWEKNCQFIQVLKLWHKFIAFCPPGFENAKQTKEQNPERTRETTIYLRAWNRLKFVRYLRIVSDLALADGASVGVNLPALT